jgi:hypothetical protein
VTGSDDLGLPVCRVGELDEPAEGTGWLVESLWGQAAVGFAAGLPKLGKTWLGLDIALSVATGTPCLDRFPVPDPGEVLVYLAEDHPASVRNRLAGLCRHRGLRLDQVAVHVITAPALRLDLERDRDRLGQTLARIRPRLLVLDPLVRLHRRDENHSGDVAELLAFLRDLQRTHDLAILVVHHMRKNGAGHAGQALRGSGDFHAWIDSGLYLRWQRDRIVLTAEHRDAPAPPPIALRLASGTEGSGTYLEVLDSPQDDLSCPQAPPAMGDRIVDQLRSAHRPLTRFELRKLLRINNQRLGEAIAHLEGTGVLVRLQHGWSLAGEANPSDGRCSGS